MYSASSIDTALREPKPHIQFAKIVSYFSQQRCRFSVLAHAPEGNTIAASQLRGHSYSCSAKTIVASARQSSRSAQRYILLVVPGNRRIDFEKAKRVLGVKKLGFAERSTAERLMGCVSGSIPPVPVNSEMDIIVDSRLKEEDFIVFNAARLDISLKLDTEDYLRTVKPILADISESTAQSPFEEDLIVSFRFLVFGKHS